jgi:hypothetical protein
VTRGLARHGGYLAGLKPLFVERLNAVIKELKENGTWSISHERRC